MTGKALYLERSGGKQYFKPENSFKKIKKVKSFSLKSKNVRWAELERFVRAPVSEEAIRRAIMPKMYVFPVGSRMTGSDEVCLPGC